MKPDAAKKDEPKEIEPITFKSRKKRINQRCPICLGKILCEQVAATVCGHIFCHGCIQKAMRLKKICPVCNKNLRRSMMYHRLYMDDC
ncbi:unnamed protein product [Plutella xylostella]|uniref:(diamondback moth) hypothetical protein n=1 Tax=Plutella xylostella TaxID=51655 RepID=A0A8S4EMX1_PLUXY|nr:unnamed protein product [Plutella xylostella]